MIAFLNKLFNLRSGEWGRLSILYLMSLVALTGINWGEAIVQGAFLQRVGVQYLPWVFISSAACSVVALFIYTAFADRVPNGQLLVAILIISVVAIGLGLGLLAGGRFEPAYLLLYLVLNVPLLDVYNVHWATYVNGFYDIRAAKRIVPVLGTAARLAGIIGGLSMPLINRLLGPSAIIAVWLVTLLVMAGLAWAMPRLLKEDRTHAMAPGAAASGAPTRSGRAAPATVSPVGHAGRTINRWSQATGKWALAYTGNLREGYRYIAQSPFLQWMALSTLAMTIMLALLNYRASAIFAAQLQTTVQISNFLGLLSGAANLVVLPIQLFLLSRLITRLGLGNASLIYPLATLAGGVGLAFAPGLATGGLAYLDRTALRTAFRNSTDNLLYNAVPLRMKGRTRAFIGGLIVPVGSILAGLLLLTPLARVPWFLPGALILLALGFILAASMVREQYAHALVAMLEQEDFSSLALQAPTGLVVADAATLAQLEKKLAESTSPEWTIFMAQLIGEIAGEAAVPLIGRVARTTVDGRVRASLVDVMVAADLRKGAARELYVELLGDPDGRVRLSAAGGLEQIDGPQDSRYLQIASRLLPDPELEVRLRVLPALLAAADPDCQSAGERALRELLDSPDAHTRARALDVIGQARVLRFVAHVALALVDRADEVRLEAALAAEMLTTGTPAAPGVAPLLPPVKRLLHDPIERVRVAAVVALGNLNGNEARQALVTALADRSAEVREKAIEALARAGKEAIPLVHPQLNAADPLIQKMAAVVLARIDPREYAPLVRGPNVNGNLLVIYHNLGLLYALAACAGPAGDVLQRTLRERNAALLDEIFYLLAAVEDPVAVKTIAGSLRSQQPGVRANAAEALESLTTPQTANLVGPLFEPDLPAEQLLSLSHQTWGLPVPTPSAAMQQLITDPKDAWLRAVAAATLAETSSAMGARTPGTIAPPLAATDVAAMLRLARADPVAEVREAAGPRREATNDAAAHGSNGRETSVLSLIEKIIFLKEVPFFQGLTIDQLKVLASVCEEEQFSAEARIFEQGDPGGAFYMVVSGRVGIEQEKRRGSSARLAMINAHAYFGESNLFDNSPRSTSAIALQDTLILRLRREPLIELARRHPDLSLELISVLTQKLREANDRIADLTRSRPRELHKLYDSLE